MLIVDFQNIPRQSRQCSILLSKIEYPGVQDFAEFGSRATSQKLLLKNAQLPEPFLVLFRCDVHLCQLIGVWN